MPRKATTTATQTTKSAGRTRRTTKKDSGSNSASNTTSAATAPSRQPSEDEIRRRAYELYVARGYQEGDPHADWVQAERELREENGS